MTARRFAISRSAQADRTIDWADPLVGVHWEVPLLDCLSLDCRFLAWWSWGR